MSSNAMTSSATCRRNPETEPAPPTLQTPDRLFTGIASELERRIASGEFAEGDRIPSERTLALEYGASRVTVHEAVLSLQSRGLLTAERRARARVRRPGPGDLLEQLSGAARTLVSTRTGVADLQEARSLFECGLARYAARHATPKQLENLAFAVAANRRALGDADLFIQTDMAFHLAIAMIPNNPIFLSLHDALNAWLVEQRSTGLRVRGSARTVCREHEAIYAAIAARDSDRADRAMSDHLASVARYYWKAAGTGEAR